MRTFDFNAPVAHRAAIAAIVAALSDEGLRLIADDNTKGRIVSVRMTVDGRFIDRYLVPKWRIAE